MAKDINVDALAKATFWLTFAGCIAYVLAVAVYVLSAEPSETPQTTEIGHHD